MPEDTNGDLVLAAGGVVRRMRDGRDEIAVIHRPKYDDWSLPKGKLHPGEEPLDAALREVDEETGHRADVVREVGQTRYRDSRGRLKEVTYWLMDARGGRFQPGSEVDELRWLPVEEAIALLDHEHDRDIVLAALPREA